MTSPRLSPLPGTRYHRLARTAAHRWWRHLLTVLAVLVTWLVVAALLYGGVAVLAALAGRPGGPDDLPGFGPRVSLAVDFLAVATLLPIVLSAAWIQGRRPGTLTAVTGRLRWGWLLRCLPVAGAALLLMFGGSAALLAVTDRGGDELGLDGGWTGLTSFAASMAVLLAVVPVQAAAEEYGFRGLLLQTFGAFARRPWVPILLQAVLFAAVHGWGTPWGFADLVVFGTLAGYLTVRTGGLEAAIALHVVNNLVATALAAATGQLTVTETAADAPWQLVVVNLPVLVGYTVVVLWLARRRGLAVVAPDGPVLPVAADGRPGPHPLPPYGYQPLPQYGYQPLPQYGYQPLPPYGYQPLPPYAYPTPAPAVPPAGPPAGPGAGGSD
jgi:membrane protease YdiL (CAAX protease family)